VDLPQPGCEETVSPTAPVSELPSDAPVPVPAPTPALCTGSMEYVHLSTSEGGIGELSVHGFTLCPIAQPQRITVTLHRERCFLWLICQWPEIGTRGYYENPSARRADANARSLCSWQSGWFKGKGFHWAMYPDGRAGYTETEGIPPNYIKCLYVTQI
jgi:hypothetical protein